MKKKTLFQKIPPENNKTHKYVCKVCKRTFPKQLNLVQHIGWQHKPEKEIEDTSAGD